MPSTDNIETKESKLMDSNRKVYKFFYNGEEYDCTNYAKKHPGGEEFFWK